VAVLKQFAGPRLTVLLYHHIGPFRAGTNPDLTISPHCFDLQMRWLAEHGYSAITASNWLEIRRGKKEVPKRPILITFDDGYEDTANYALPAIRRYGLAATVYVVTSQIGGSDACWQQARGRRAFHRLIDARQILSWAEGGIEFGAHSRTHPELTALGSEQLAEEVEGSSDDLNRLLGARPASFAYPYGVYNRAVRDHVSRSFDSAVTCEAGCNRLPTDPYALRRAEIMPADGMVGFRWRLRFGATPAQVMRQRLHKYAHHALATLRSSAHER